MMPLGELPDRRWPVHLPGVESGNRTVIYFVTICTQDRAPVLACETAHHLLLAAWAAADSFLVGRYVVMPDHIHLFCSPGESSSRSLVQWMAFWRSLTARNWRGSEEGKLWQRGYWDTQLRRGESYAEKWEYVRQNPVRAGLVGALEDWVYQGEINRLEWHD